jgi:hypothetical protein
VIITNVASRAVYVGEVSPHQEGARVSMPLFLESRGDVGGVRFTLAYDRNVLTEPEIQWESPIGGAVTSSNTNQPGTVIGTFVLSGTTVSTGVVQFATLTFRSRSVPINTTVQLRLTVTGLFNAVGDPLSSVGTDVRSGTVQIKVRKFKGDNNANDRLDVGDAATIMRFDNLLEFPRPWDAPKNDLNSNAQLDAGDVIRVLRAVVGLDPQPSVPGPQSLGAAAVLRAAATSGRLALQLDKLTAATGEEVKLTVQLSQYSGPLVAASFKLQFPTNALKLLNSTSHRTGSIVPAGAAILWNVSPAQNDYAIQNGAIALAVSSDRNWTTDQGVLAEFTFVVQPGATNNHQWPITLSHREISTGLDVFDASGGEIFFVGREAVAPQFSAAPVLTEDGLVLSFSAEVGIRYRIEISEDLTNWLPLATVTGDGTTLNVTDAEGAQSERRFYRAVQID